MLEDLLKKLGGTEPRLKLVEQLSETERPDPDRGRFQRRQDV